jgi:hypothetical protein
MVPHKHLFPYIYNNLRLFEHSWENLPWHKYYFSNITSKLFLGSYIYMVTYSLSFEVCPHYVQNQVQISKQLPLQ